MDFEEFVKQNRAAWLNKAEVDAMAVGDTVQVFAICRNACDNMYHAYNADAPVQKPAREFLAPVRGSWTKLDGPHHSLMQRWMEGGDFDDCDRQPLHALYEDRIWYPFEDNGALPDHLAAGREDADPLKWDDMAPETPVGYRGPLMVRLCQWWFVLRGACHRRVASTRLACACACACVCVCVCVWRVGLNSLSLGGQVVNRTPDDVALLWK